ncbi:MAG: hypothetical protein D6794_10285 [Deltaproteobacteria bacterium]|nr:MAG: hypothetical protein D6794_10285 [Deltaproteobacteria bacterium]
MARRILAIDPRQTPWQLAVARQGRPAPTLERVVDMPSEGDLMERLTEALGAPPGPDDRIALGIPCTDLFIRWLAFPFTDRRKVRAAVGPELARQLPVEFDSLHLVFRRQPANTGAQVLAVAIERARLEQLIEPCATLEDRFHSLIPAPFALADALAADRPEGLLVCVSDADITLVRLKSGVPCDVRVQARSPGQKSIDQVSFIVRQGRIMLEARSQEDAVILLAGEACDGELGQALTEFGFRVLPACPADAPQDLRSNQYGAAALALGCGRKSTDLNLLSGPYAPRGDWKRLRPRLLTAAVLFSLVLALVLGAGWLQQAGRQRQLAALDQELERLYRQAFPNEKRVIDPVRQLDAKLKQLGRTGASGPGLSALEALRLLSSSIPADVSIRIVDYSYSPDGIRIEGETTSFETVSRLMEVLRSRPAFAEVNLADSRQKSSGQTVQFRLQLRLKEAG